MNDHARFFSSCAALVILLLLAGLLPAPAVALPRGEAPGSIPRAQSLGPADPRGTAERGASQQPSGAKKSPLFLPFGGRIITEAICHNGILLVLSPPTPGPYLLPPPPAAVIFAFYLPFIPNWVIGNALPGGVCNCPDGGCEVIAGVGAVGGFVVGGPGGAVIGAVAGELIGSAALNIPAKGTIYMIGTSGFAGAF